ncbi:tumor necrosis factor receptor superfamily member 10A isoform X2 [Bombina bombina]|uniref:tumor necrosis factor receptor superfamily member 10A isoform X2 n=1 Tax=Bombina bombina TaxID=8345 RepID=UPI00235AAFBC|nr:tumor necrosis factor receptor superfamily member 10A isoform X2 [Bombina bombina]
MLGICCWIHNGFISPGRDMATMMVIITLFLLVDYTHGGPLRTIDSNENETHYTHEGIRCRRCDAGTYVEKVCTVPDEQGTCKPCQLGINYSEHLTGLAHCLSCTTCRDDEEEVSLCTPTKNRVCRCKNGTFCPPEHPCEICLPCTTSCPPGQVLQQPCNSTSDTQCDISAGHSRKWLIWIYILGPILLFIIIVLFTFCKVKQYNVFSLCLNVLNRASSKLQSEEPNTMIPLLPLSLPEGTDHDNEDNTIRRAFDIFAKNVKPNEWTRFMRSLRLSDTDIQDAERTFPMNPYEQRYNMLTTWREQTGSNNVNTLLQNLYSLNMRRTANDIIKKLIQEQLYVSNTWCCNDHAS